tara:strand:+ start:342 stop:521 length:180 start_codon:yes stop_codon:yes gene_type:complete
MARPIKKYQKGGKLPKRKPKPGEKGGVRETPLDLSGEGERNPKNNKRKGYRIKYRRTPL